MNAYDFEQLPENMKGGFSQAPQKAVQYGSRICPNCGFTGMPKKVTRGSGLVAVALWFCFLVPGLIYSLWRMTARKIQLCPRCGKDVS